MTFSNFLGFSIFFGGLVLLIVAAYQAVPTMLDDPLSSFIIAIAFIIVGGLTATNGNNRSKGSTMHKSEV